MGGLFEEVVEANGTVKQRSHVGDFLIDERSGPVEAPTISRRYLIRDNLGSVSVILDDNLADGLVSSILSSPSYDAFGAEATSTRFNASADVANMTRGYTDHEQFDDLGIIHMNGRIYDADLGRFLSADPLVPHPYFSQSYNRYSYVLNNPMSLTDPSGFEDDKCQGRWGDIPLEDAEELDICGGFGSCNPGTSPSPAPSAPKGPTLIKQYTQNPSTRAYHFVEKRMSDFKRWDSAPEFSRDWDRQTFANVGSAVAPDAVASGELSSSGRVTSANDLTPAQEGLTSGWSFGDPLPQGLVDGIAGFGDMFGAGYIREWLDIDGGVDESSGAYFGGALAAGLFVPVGRLGYVLQARRIPGIAQTAKQAVGMRNRLKWEYRGPLASYLGGWHMSSYTSLVQKGKTSAEILARSGATNLGFNIGLIGGGTAIGAARAWYVAD